MCVHLVCDLVCTSHAAPCRMVSLASSLRCHLLRPLPSHAYAWATSARWCSASASSSGLKTCMMWYAPSPSFQVGALCDALITRTKLFFHHALFSFFHERYTCRQVMLTQLQTGWMGAGQQDTFSCYGLVRCQACPLQCPPALATGSW